jgi:hypothetical protein
MRSKLLPKKSYTLDRLVEVLDDQQENTEDSPRRIITRMFPKMDWGTEITVCKRILAMAQAPTSARTSSQRDQPCCAKRLSSIKYGLKQPLVLPSLMS